MRRIALDNEWNTKINAFIKENEPTTTSCLAEASTLNIIYELRRRGYKGTVKQLSDDGTLVIESFDLDKQEWNHNNAE